jgi:hypothetical protein
MEKAWAWVPLLGPLLRLFRPATMRSQLDLLQVHQPEVGFMTRAVA